MHTGRRRRPPVRLALGLPLPSESLAVEAAASLLRAGVCIGDMVANGSPDLFCEAMRKAGATQMGMRWKVMKNAGSAWTANGSTTKC